MKTILFAAALLAGTAATAQDYPDTSMDPIAAPTTTMEAPPTTMTTADAWAASTGTSVAPDNSNPEHDARGIAVISDPASVPPGFNGTTAVAVGGPLEPVAGDDSYPACSATITDNCLQTYERGRSPQ